MLGRFHESELTQSEFVTQHGIGLSTLSKWLRLESEAPSLKVKFQEVRIADRAVRATSFLTVRIEVIAAARRAMESWR